MRNGRFEGTTRPVVNRGLIARFHDVYYLEVDEAATDLAVFERGLQDDPAIAWWERQVGRQMVARRSSHRPQQQRPVAKDEEENGRRTSRSLSPLPPPYLRLFFMILLPMFSAVPRFNDKSFSLQWHLYNENQNQFDLNVTGAWNQPGILSWGANVVNIAIVDNGAFGLCQLCPLP